MPDPKRRSNARWSFVRASNSEFIVYPRIGAPYHFEHSSLRRADTHVILEHFMSPAHSNQLVHGPRRLALSATTLILFVTSAILRGMPPPVTSAPAQTTDARRATEFLDSILQKYRSMKSYADTLHVDWYFEEGHGTTDEDEPRSSIAESPTKLLISTAMRCPAFSAATRRSAPKSTYISLLPHDNRSGSCVMIQPSFMSALRAWR